METRIDKRCQEQAEELDQQPDEDVGLAVAHPKKVDPVADDA